MDHEDIFNKIIVEALAQACAVPCPLEEFIEALSSWRGPFGPIQEEVDAARDSLGGSR